MESMSVISNEKGFTIIELLIVIIVIGILAAITIVSFNGVTTRAQDATTSAGVRSLTDQIQGYKVEHSDNIPGYDQIKVKSNNDSSGNVLYSFQDLTSDYNNSGAIGLTGASFQGQYNVNPTGRTAYIAFSIASGGTYKYYIGSFAIGIYGDKNAILAENRIPRMTDNVVPNVSGWYSLSSNAIKVANGVMTCNNGSALSAASPTGATWTGAYKYQSIQTPLLVNGKVSLGAKSLFILKTDVNCGAGYGGTLYELVYNDSGSDPKYGFPAAYPIDTSTTLYDTRG